MRWPWSRRERRDSGGDFADAVVRLIEAQAAGTAADASSTAAVEAAAGALSRAFAAAEVVGEPWAQETVSPAVLGQIGRDLIRKGDSLHARYPRRRRWHGAADPLLVLALGGLARSRELDRPGDRLRAVDVDHMEPAGVGGRIRPVGQQPRVSPTSAPRRHRGRTPPPGSAPRSSDRSRTRRPGRSRNCWRCRKGRTRAATTATIRWRRSGPTSQRRGGGRCFWKRPPPGSAKGGQTLRSATGTRGGWAPRHRRSWLSFAAMRSSMSLPRAAPRQVCSPTRTARRSARPSGVGILAPSCPSRGWWSMS